ncbi:MAG: hypothetical protein M1477_04490 [Candidatus Thermoplasmatota archaeon]|nr:hypothetical protein [Candidatus Thermoplasmatota archaeon]
MEFWNSEITNDSWNELLVLSRTYNFILIGGWAIYLYTKLQKSRDIDIVVDYDQFWILSKDFQLRKNPSLRKYEIKFQKFDIDVYTPFYSRLTVPVQDLINNFTIIENIKVPKIEELLILKLGAFDERVDSIKGQKDRLDIAGLVFYSSVDYARFTELLNKYEKRVYYKLLMNAVGNIDPRLLRYLNLNESTYAKIKKKALEVINSNLKY